MSTMTTGNSYIIRFIILIRIVLKLMYQCYSTNCIIKYKCILEVGTNILFIKYPGTVPLQIIPLAMPLL